jgi:hypothetical protein
VSESDLGCRYASPGARCEGASPSSDISSLQRILLPRTLRYLIDMDRRSGTRTPAPGEGQPTTR